MKKQLVSIVPVKAGIVLGTIQGLLALVIIVPLGLVMTAMITSISHLNQQSAGVHQSHDIAGALGLFGSLAMIIILPIAYAVVGFITGVIIACVYNLIAKMTGGLEFEVRDLPPNLQ